MPRAPKNNAASDKGRTGPAPPEHGDSSFEDIGIKMSAQSRVETSRKEFDRFDIDFAELDKLIDQGLTAEQIANQLGGSESLDDSTLQLWINGYKDEKDDYLWITRYCSGESSFQGSERDAIAAFLNACKTYDHVKCFRGRETLRLMGDAGRDIHQFYEDAVDRERIEAETILTDMVTRSIDIKLPTYHNVSQFLDGLRELRGASRQPTEERTERSRGPVQSLDDKIKEMIPDLPEGYEGRLERLAELNAATRRVIAVQLADALNARIGEMPSESLEEKKELARWVMAQLEPLGLAVKCPNTDLPATFRATTGSSSWPDVGRFYFEVYRDGKREKSAYSESLPQLVLIDGTPRKESEGPWQQAVKPKPNRRGRSHR